MESWIRQLELINERAGRFFSWSTGLLVLLICVDVIMRYAFNFTLIWILEMESYLFAVCFLMASGYAFKHDRHVRVDVFYCNYSTKGKAWTNFLGGIFFFIAVDLGIYLCLFLLFFEILQYFRKFCSAWRTSRPLCIEIYFISGLCVASHSGRSQHIEKLPNN